MVKREQNGLYNATNEHDACGVGMVVNIHGIKGTGEHAPSRCGRS